ncbi:YkvA family protein [Nocardiopsis sp. NPDC006938]|uniref:YkvA family protein n=1 Tax=Nocardiopsis sp. NPDC006938 TaxID=3364337 RepID=UPI00368C41C0
MRKANRAAAGAAAWQVIQNTDSKVSLWDRVRAIPRMLGAKLRGRYPGLGGGKLFMMVVLVGYILSPIDFVPELIFSVFGLVDDVAVAVWLTTMALGESERFVVWERDVRAQQAFDQANQAGPGRYSGHPNQGQHPGPGQHPGAGEYQGQHPGQGQYQAPGQGPGPEPAAHRRPRG